MSDIKQAACVGGGVIGSAWAARFSINGIDTMVYDPAPDAQRKLDEVLANADRAMAKLTMAPLRDKGTVRLTNDLEEAVATAQFIQESAPEREDLKKSIYGDIEKFAATDALIATSTSGLLPSQLQADMADPDRFLVGHPFNPVYLLPLVEVVGGNKTSAASIERAKTFYAGIGMHPLHVRKEIDAFIADRLMEALWREALWLVHDDVATTQEIDDAVRYGCGLRWALMGTFQTFWLAGGEGGMRHMLEQFGPALKWPWSKLTDVPELTEEFIETIANQCDAQANGMTPREMEPVRDDCLIAIMQALKTQEQGAGATLLNYEKQLFDKALKGTSSAEHDYSKPLRLFDITVPPDWTDYNNHMNESRYLQAFCHCSDTLLKLIGSDEAYVAAGNSYYTVETHLMHIREAAGLDPIYVTTQILGMDEKRLHVFSRLYHGRTNELLATGEQMFLHVDSKAQKACPAAPHILEKIAEIYDGHKLLDWPKGAGRSVGQKHS